MKKIMALLTGLMCFASANAFAQEVRGIETRRVIYEGPKYSCGNQYYGWEFTNRNSCAVSVDATLFHNGGTYGNAYHTEVIPSTPVKTQSFVLNAGESYIFKREGHYSTRVECNDGFSIDEYRIEYKAYKLQ